MKTTWRLISIILITAVAVIISLPYGLHFKIGKYNIDKNFDLKLGLDLAGGSHLVFETDMSGIPKEKQEIAIAGVRDVIERRVNLFGVSEPSVQTSKFENKDRIIVDLPGVSNTAEAIKLIGATAQLQFAEVTEVAGSGTASPSANLSPTNLTGADLETASVVFDDQTGKPTISLQFTKEGGDKFAEITGKNIGKQIPIILDNQIVSAPVVQQQIIGGTAQITGDFTIEEAKQIAIQLNAGALPVPAHLVQETSLGATLGEASVNQSIFAGVVGLSMVGLFMLLRYGLYGLIADIGLFIFAVLTISLYKLIPVTLTLPGIAGFMLSIGMAVDSNILIFERFKEERLKRKVSDALEVSFGKAWDSIRDANIATLFTAFILANPLDWQFLHTSGPVRGFAITLALGIAISLFTGIFVSRNLLRIFVRDKT